MSTRRRSVAPNPPISLASSTRSTRRSSTAAFAAPAISKGRKPAPPKPARSSKSATKKTTEESSFVAADTFDFSGMESPKGPMTRSRRSSMYVAPLKKGLPLTSTQRRSTARKSRKLDSVMETPEVSLIRPKTDEEEAEVSFNSKRTPKVVLSPLKMKPALPKLIMPKSSTNNILGTPQPTDPANLLKKNLKRKVDIQMDKKIAEIPKNSSPYTLIRSESENGSPRERFVKLNEVPSKEIVTGTPAPNKRRVLQALDSNKKKSPSRRSSRKLAVTPKVLDLENDIASKSEEDSIALETENQAVNKMMAKQGDFAGGHKSAEIVTGDLASLCLIM